MTEIRESIIRNLKKVCSEKNVKNIDIANYLGVSQGSVTNWFKGTNFIDIDNLYSLCSFLGVSLSDILPTSGSTLSDDERQLVRLYRCADYRARSDALRMLQEHQLSYIAVKVI